jgi:putative PIN family toxin of toxin-antitoxin system
MRALYDTTILASGIVARADPLARVLDAVVSGQVELVTSDYILEELRRTLETKPYFMERVSPSERETYLTRIKAAAILVAPTGAVSGVVADPADDPMLDAAVSAKADYLVTGDKRILAVNEYAGVNIVTARAFYDLLIAEEGAETDRTDAPSSPN